MPPPAYGSAELAQDVDLLLKANEIDIVGRAREALTRRGYRRDPRLVLRSRSVSHAARQPATRRGDKPSPSIRT
ncbi:DNA methylase [Mycobacterium tuberculosis]|uniref:DNA methylase n=1 Tax=Mycobacterium tuberculosis TaxID=1773 RepID=A0A916L800_MYCTX|nr:DNA methylase [Mycobacterium tuberculosis]